jgi:hypothetical protein
LDKEKLFEWYNSGIRTIDEIGSEHDAKAIIYKIKQAYFDNKAIVDKEKITSFLSKIQSPMTAMDMEMWGPAIPQINGTKPFEQLPYLVCFFDGKKHSNVFLEYAKDDRRQFAELLLENTKGFESILVYDGTMEKMVINGLIKLFADLKPDLEHLKTKFIDIFDIFLEFSYYHPAFKTNFSLKTVAGVLLEDINYSKITSGLEAMAYFDQQRLETNLTEKEIIKQELINYCQTDTLATYQLVDFLLSCI